MGESDKKGRRTGRTNNQLYYLVGGWRMLLPRFVRRWQRSASVAPVAAKAGCGLYTGPRGFLLPGCRRARLGGKARPIKDFRLKGTPSRYFFDLGRYVKGFPGESGIDYMTTDVWENPDTPTLMKARRLDGKADNCALLNLDCRF